MVLKFGVCVDTWVGRSVSDEECALMVDVVSADGDVLNIVFFSFHIMLFLFHWATLAVLILGKTPINAPTQAL